MLHACCGPCSLEPSRILREQGHELTIFYANSNIAPAPEYVHRLETLRAWAAPEGIAVEEGVYEQAKWQRTAGRIGVAALEEARGKLRGEHGEAVEGETALGEVAGSEPTDRLPVEDAAADESAEGPSTGGESLTEKPAESKPVETAPAPASSQPGFGAYGELTLDEAAALAVDPKKRAARCRACYRLRLEEAARQAAAQGFEGLSTTLAVSPYQYSDIIHEELQRAAAQAGLQAVFEDFRPFYSEATRRSRELGMYRQNYCGCLISDLEARAERAQRKAERKALHAAERAAYAEERAAEQAQREARKAERAAYDAKQAKKRAILKALRQANAAKSNAEGE